MTWECPYCPNMISGIWRIKPDEPKKVKLEAWIDEDGSLMHKANFGEGYVARGSWIRIPELDREITAIRNIVWNDFLTAAMHKGY